MKAILTVTDSKGQKHVFTGTKYLIFIVKTTVNKSQP